MTPFEKATAETYVIEGGYVDDPQDPGGATNLGVTQCVLDDMRAKHPDWALPASVADINQEQAARIYRTYWDAVCGDSLPAPLASCLFKQAINQGATRSVIELQDSLGLALDGYIGPVTLAAANHKDSRQAVIDFITSAEINYIKSSNFRRFGKGWLRRAIRTAVEAFA